LDTSARRGSKHDAAPERAYADPQAALRRSVLKQNERIEHTRILTTTDTLAQVWVGWSCAGVTKSTCTDLYNSLRKPGHVDSLHNEPEHALPRTRQDVAAH
jgi:hypothetical protein